MPIWVWCGNDMKEAEPLDGVDEEELWTRLQGQSVQAAAPQWLKVVSAEDDDCRVNTLLLPYMERRAPVVP